MAESRKRCGQCGAWKPAWGAGLVCGECQRRNEARAGAEERVRIEAQHERVVAERRVVTTGGPAAEIARAQKQVVGAIGWSLVMDVVIGVGVVMTIVGVWLLAK